MSDAIDAPGLIDLEVKLAYQERLIRDLDTLVRDLGDRVVKTERELRELKDTIRSGGAPTMGGANEKPPHY